MEEIGLPPFHPARHFSDTFPDRQKKVQVASGHLVQNFKFEFAAVPSHMQRQFSKHYFHTPTTTRPILKISAKLLGTVKNSESLAIF